MHFVNVLVVLQVQCPDWLLVQKNKILCRVLSLGLYLYDQFQLWTHDAKVFIFTLAITSRSMLFFPFLIVACFLSHLL